LKLPVSHRVVFHVTPTAKKLKRDTLRELSESQSVKRELEFSVMEYLHGLRSVKNKDL
jgi:hypothetical protein